MVSNGVSNGMLFEAFEPWLKQIGNNPTKHPRTQILASEILLEASFLHFNND